MTVKDTFYAIRALGMAVQYNDKEWQVNYRREDLRRTPESSYFTNDNQDALDTAIAMSKYKKSLSYVERNK
jgi:hypothetical protein